MGLELNFYTFLKGGSEYPTKNWALEQLYINISPTTMNIHSVLSFNIFDFHANRSITRIGRAVTAS